MYLFLFFETGYWISLVKIQVMLKVSSNNPQIILIFERYFEILVIMTYIKNRKHTSLILASRNNFNYDFSIADIAKLFPASKSIVCLDLLNNAIAFISFIVFNFPFIGSFPLI